MSGPKFKVNELVIVDIMGKDYFGKVWAFENGYHLNDIRYVVKIKAVTMTVKESDLRSGHHMNSLLKEVL